MMKKMIILLSLMAALTLSCTSTPSPRNQQAAESTPEFAAPAPAPVSESPQIAALRKEAHERGLKWHISCHSNTDNSTYYIAWAVPADATFRLYWEDGAKPSWFRSDFATQEGAATWLSRAIKSLPNNLPDHKPREKPDNDRCNGIIEGE